MSFAYTGAKEKFGRGEIAWHTSDIRAMLVMTNTTADTDQDAVALAGIGTMDEYDGSGYARVALGAEAVNRDDPNNRAELDANDFTWTALGAGTRQAQAMVVYKHVDGTAANDVPIAFIDTGGFPFAGNGGDVTIQWSVEGIVQLT
jgi:hypothetical protein